MDFTKNVPTFERKHLKHFWNTIYGRMFNGKCRELSLRGSSGDPENYRLIVLPNIDKMHGKLAINEQ